MRTRKTPKRDAVLSMLRVRPMTRQQIAAEMRCSYESAQQYIIRLVQSGHAVEAQKSVAGRPMFSATDAAPAAIRRLVDRIEEHRESYADGVLSQQAIANLVGCSQEYVSKHARANGWAQRRMHFTTGTPYRPAAAHSSVWSLAAGVMTSTARHGGKHIEVTA